MSGAPVVAVNLVHRPDRTPIELESISQIHEQGVILCLTALGYLKVNGKWWSKEHLVVIDMESPNRRLGVPMKETGEIKDLGSKNNEVKRIESDITDVEPKM